MAVLRTGNRRNTALSLPLPIFAARFVAALVA
jgi:hypothetical protein